jgi:hypothetical protein
MLLPRGFVEVPRLHVQLTVAVLTNRLCFGHDFKRSHFVIWQMKDFGVQEFWVQFNRVSIQAAASILLNFNSWNFCHCTFLRMVIRLYSQHMNRVQHLSIIA